jgi:hypothetical protein
MAGTLDKSTADAPDKTPWHPAFCAATELELQEDMDILHLEQEFPLSKEPIRIDLLISKNNERTIKNEIGHIMRTYNIIEYKSPKAGMNIDDSSFSGADYSDKETGSEAAQQPPDIDGSRRNRRCEAIP